MKYTVFLLTPLVVFEGVEADSEAEARKLVEEKYIPTLPEGSLDPDDPHQLLIIKEVREAD